MALSAEALLEYACEKFENQCYDEALEAFVLAYDKGYEQEWVLENIYNCYMGANEQEFFESYRKGKKGEVVPYEQCLLDFVPYKEGKYYIFDKELNIFRGIYEIPNQKDREDDSLKELEFSSLALGIEWNLTKWNAAIAEVRNRKVYIVCEDIRRGISFCKIPELAEYMRDITFFAGCDSFENYFHENTSIYLPKAFAGDEGIKNELIEIVNHEHEYRLTPEGRNTDNVLLTIGIPTHDRGNLLLKRLENLRRMPYDAEIEFAISKNGTHYYQEEYQQIEKIPDTRINYYDHNRDLKAVENWHYTIEMAHGKYVLLVSDEDDVMWENLEHYFRLLNDNPKVNLVRVSSRRFYNDIEEQVYGKKGLKAFHRTFLRQNYLSGLVLKREDFLKENLLELEIFSDNVFYQYYPHEWWCARLSMNGDYIEDPIVLIEEKESVFKEEVERYQELGVLEKGEWLEEDSDLPVYATYEERLKQFQGEVDFLQWMMGDYLDGIVDGLYTIIGKTGYLLEMGRVYNYECENFENIVEQYLFLCITAVDRFQLEEIQKANLLLWAKEKGILLLELHDKLNSKEA